MEYLRKFDLTDEAVNQTDIPEVWKVWGNAAWAFHTATKDAPFISPTKNSGQQLTQYFEDLAQRKPPPSPTTTTVTGDELFLPRLTPAETEPYFRVVESRRTHRSFRSDTLSISTFSMLLQKTFGPFWFSYAKEMGTLQLRGAASGGARQDVVPYFLVRKVTGIPEGMYEYDDLLHALRPHSKVIAEEQLDELIYYQDITHNAAFVTFLTSDVRRLHWKYPHPRAMRVLYQNSGCVAQLFSMNATALGMGASMTGAFCDTLLTEALDIDPDNQFPTFIMACGRPRLRDDQLPTRHSHFEGEPPADVE